MLLLAAALWLWPLALPLVDKADSAGYVSVASSVVDDGDLLYLDDYRELEMWERYARPSPTGLVANHWTLGPGLALAPPYALRALFAPERTVPSAAAYAAFQATALLWLLATLIAVRTLIRRLGLLPKSAAVLVIYLGSPLVYYAHVQAVRPHLLETLLIATFLLLGLGTSDRSTVRALALGSLCGALYLVRPQMAGIAAFVAAEQIHALWNGRSDLRKTIRDELVRGTAFALPTLSFMWIAARYSQLLYGDVRPSLWTGLFDVDFDIIASLISAHHGLFAWSPVLLLATFGLALFLRDHPRLIPPVVVFLGCQLYLNGTSFDQVIDEYHHTRHVGGGFSFGGRRYVGCTPLLAIGFAALWQRGMAAPRWRWPLRIAVGLAVLWSLDLFVYARAEPAILIEPLTWPRLLEIHGEAIGRLPRSMAWWREHMPGVPAAAVGWLTAAIQAAAIALLWRLWTAVPGERRSVVAVAVALVSTVWAVSAWSHLEERTRKASIERAPALEGFRRRAASRTPAISRDIFIEQARLAVLFGDYDKALVRYEAALRIAPSDDLQREYVDAAARAGVER